MITITVYSKPQCVQCDATYRALDKASTKYETIDITEDARAYAYVKELGHMQAPGVVIKDENGALVDHFSGFRPDLLKKYAELVTAA